MIEYIPLITSGMKTTLLMFLIVMSLSIPLGFIITLMRTSKIPPFRWISALFIYVIRGTPLLLQLLFFCYGFSLIFPISRETAAVLAFVLNYAAYLAEIFRGGLLSVDKGQFEASKVLGLSRYQTLSKIVIPQMFKVILPPLSNEAITLIKDTALVFTIGMTDIISFTKNAANNLVSFYPFIYAGILYLFITFILTMVFKALEKRFMFE